MSGFKLPKFDYYTCPKQAEEYADHIRQAAQNLADSNGKPVLTYKQALDLVKTTSITAKEIEQFFHLVEG